MARESAPAGVYVLTGVLFRQKNDKGGFTTYEQGDEVNLNAEEAARLVGWPNSCFKVKESATTTPTDTPSDSTDTTTKTTKK